MNRRDLFKTLGALATAAALPISVADEWELKGLIEFQNFVIHEPIFIPKGFSIVIRDCTFKAAENFVGDALLILEEGKNNIIQNCHFDLDGQPFIAAIHVTAQENIALSKISTSQNYS